MFLILSLNYSFTGNSRTFHLCLQNSITVLSRSWNGVAKIQGFSRYILKEPWKPESSYLGPLQWSNYTFGGNINSQSTNKQTNKQTNKLSLERKNSIEKQMTRRIRKILYISNGTKVNISKGSGNHGNVSSCQNLTVMHSTTMVHMQSHQFYSQSIVNGESSIFIREENTAKTWKLNFTRWVPCNDWTFELTSM